MASIQPPKGDTPTIQGYRIAPSSRIYPDAIDDILGCCLIWFLPALFFAGLIVLGTMLISHTLVMRIPLPPRFTLIIVIIFAGLITITFFLLMVFHIRRCKRRIPSQRVRFALSEASSVTDKRVSGSWSSSHSSEFSQMAVLNVAVPALVPASVPASAQDISAIPLRRVKCHADIKQAAQDQDSNKALVALESTGLLHDSARVLPPSSHSSLENDAIHGNQWPLRPSPPHRLSPLVIASPTPGDAPPTVPFVPEQPKEEIVYYQPPGAPRPLPSAGFRPIWANDIEKKKNRRQP